MIDDGEIGVDDRHERRDAERVIREQEQQQRTTQEDRRKNIIKYHLPAKADSLPFLKNVFAEIIQKNSWKSISSADTSHEHRWQETTRMNCTTT